MSVTKTGLTVSGTYTGTVSTSYLVEITTQASTDKYRWSDDGGTTYEAINVSCSTVAVSLNNGISITFAAVGSHNINESWQWSSHHVIPINTKNMAMINDDGRRDVVFYDETNEGINTIVDLHGSVPSLGTISSTTKSSVAMQVNNKEVHIGLGSAALEYPKWAGIVSYKQFGTDYSGSVTIEDAALTSPSTFTDLYSTVDIGDYIYGIEWQGKYVYKFNKTKQIMERKSEQTFLKTQGLAARNIDVDGNKGLWVFDGDPAVSGSNAEGRLYALTTDDMSETFHCDITATTASTMDDFTSTISDIIQTGDITNEDVLWFSRYVIDETFPNSPADSNEWLWSVTTPTSSVALDPLNRSISPVLNSNFGYQTLGDLEHRSYARLASASDAVMNGFAQISDDYGIDANCVVADTTNKLLFVTDDEDLTSWSYTEAGVVAFVEEVGSAGNINKYSIDIDNRIIFCVKAGGVRSYTYDTSGNISSLVDSDTSLSHLPGPIACDAANNILFVVNTDVGKENSELASYTYDSSGNISARVSMLVNYNDEDPGDCVSWDHMYPNRGVLYIVGSNQVAGFYTFLYNTSTGVGTGWDAFNFAEHDSDIHADFESATNLREIACPKPGDATPHVFIAEYRSGSVPRLYSFSVSSVGAITEHASSPFASGGSAIGQYGSITVDTKKEQLITSTKDTSGGHKQHIIFWNYDDSTGVLSHVVDLDVKAVADNVSYGTHADIDDPKIIACDPIYSLLFIGTANLGFFHARYMERPKCSIPKKCLIEANDTEYVGVITNPDDNTIEIYDGSAWQTGVTSLLSFLKYGRTAWSIPEVANNTEVAYRTAIPDGDNLLSISSYGDAMGITSGVLGAATSKVYHYTRPVYNPGSNITAITSPANATIDSSESTVSLESATKYNIFAGNGVGQWLGIIYSGSTFFHAAQPILQSLVQLELANSATGDGFANTQRVWYKASFLYDGYQESPMGDLAEDSSGNTYIDSNGKDVDITITFRTADSVSKRVSHLRLYRAVETASGAGDNPSVYFRFFRQMSLDTNFELDDSDSSNPTWETVRERIIVDNYSINGASYESITGISETLDNTSANYGLSAQLNNQHFVAKCYHPQIDDADNFIFKSKPYNYDQFDVSVDLLKLPTTPTALAAYNGRIYAFDENNTYRIEPNYLYVEDTFEGVGCLNQGSVSVTEYGMCFLDKNNIYLHNGVQPVPIGDAIVRGDTKAWQNISSNWTPKVLFDASRNSYVALFYDGSGDYYGWAFNLTRRRWDLWHFDSTEPKGCLTGKNGEIFICNGTNLINWLGGSSNDAWSWTSKKITMDTSTQVKFFKKTRVAGISSSCIDTIITSEGTPTKSGSTDGDEDYVYSLSGSNAKAKWIQYTIADESGSNTVDAIGTVFRRRGVK